MNCWRLCGKLKLKTLEDPFIGGSYTFLSFTSRVLTWFSQLTLEENHLVLLAGKRNPLKIYQSILLFLTRSTLRFTRLVQHLKSINVIHHINRLKKKKKSHDHISRCRKIIWQNSTPLMIKILTNWVYKEHTSTE